MANGDMVMVRARPVALEPTTLSEANDLATRAAASGLFAVRRPEEALVILLTGRELGLSAMASLRGIYVVSGRPVLSADLLVAVVRQSGLCRSWRVVESTAERCEITTQRVDEAAPASKVWTRADAARAQLASRPIWQQYPAQMLRHRCAADLVREQYPEVALGLYTPDELDAAPAPRDHSPHDTPDAAAFAPSITPRMQREVLAGQADTADAEIARHAILGDTHPDDNEDAEPVESPLDAALRALAAAPSLAAAGHVYRTTGARWPDTAGDDRGVLSTALGARLRDLGYALDGKERTAVEGGVMAADVAAWHDRVSACATDDALVALWRGATFAEDVAPGMKRILARRSAMLAGNTDTKAAGARLAALLAPPAAAFDLAAFRAHVAGIELPGEGVAVWLKHRAEINRGSVADRETAWEEIAAKVAEVGGMKGAKGWLKRAVSDEDSRTDPAAHLRTKTSRAEVLASAAAHADRAGYAEACARRLVDLSAGSEEGTLDYDTTLRAVRAHVAEHVTADAGAR